MKTFITYFFLIVSTLPIKAQFNEKLFDISVSLSYTSSSKLFLNPNSIDVIQRSQFTPFEDIISYAVEARYRISEPLIVGLRIEYLEASETFPNIFLGAPIGVLEANSREGFTLFPIEFSLYYVLPFSTEQYKFFIGGGGGIYFGEHIREFLNIKAQNVRTSTDAGIQIAMGLEYLPVEFLSIRGEMRFRDPQYKITSKYSESYFTYNGFIYRINTDPFDSKVNVDGVTFTIGISYQF